jgi:hypothetical protein
MSAPLHPQNVIALIWDFDKTLIPGYMQDPIFAKFSIDGLSFWREVNALPEHYRGVGVNVHPDTCYLNRLLTYVQTGRMPGLTNAMLKELGRDIKFHEGLPDFFPLAAKELKKVPDADRFELHLEHYIVSTGLREMIEGSAIRPYVDGIWASEFIETAPSPGFQGSLQASSGPGPGSGNLLGDAQAISQIATAYDNTSKTRAIFEINKGSNKDKTINVNATMKPEDRRVPFKHMIYIADGPSDVPAFSLMRQNGGIAYAVYDDESEASQEQVDRLRKEGRIDHSGPANYQSTSPTAKWLFLQIRNIAKGIVTQRKEAIRTGVGQAPRHL